MSLLVLLVKGFECGTLKWRMACMPQPCRALENNSSKGVRLPNLGIDQSNVRIVTRCDAYVTAALGLNCIDNSSSSALKPFPNEEEGGKAP